MDQFRARPRLLDEAPRGRRRPPKPISSRRPGTGRLGALLLAVSLFTSACDAERTPVGPDPSQASLSAALGYQPGWSATREDALKPLLEREKARIAREQERSQRTYDSLKYQWDRFLRNSPGRNSSPLLMCDPLQYAADTKIIGPEGGDMSVGPHKLSIPRGALKQYTVITAEQPVSAEVTVKFSPHGLQFVKQPTLTLVYKHCYVPNDFAYRLAYLGDDNSILEWPSSYDRRKDGELLGWIGHFSRYGVATGRRATY